MKLNPDQRAAERIALILLDFDEAVAEEIINDADDLTSYVRHRRTIPVWLPGLKRHRLNQRLAQLKTKARQRKKSAQPKPKTKARRRKK